MKNNVIKLIGLKIVNAGLLEAIEVQFDNNGIVIFAGDNRQGKTTILKALAILLFGKKALPNEFMTHNKKKMEIKGTFNNFIITRTKTEIGDLRVSITDSAGIPISEAPQTFIDTFLSKEVINPQPFIEKDGDAIYQYLLDFAKIDTTEIDNEIVQLENDRLLKGREKTNSGKPIKVDKTESVNIDDILAFNKLQIERQNNLDEANKLSEKLQTEKNEVQLLIEEYEKKIKSIKQDVEILDDRIVKGSKHISKLDHPEKEKPVSELVKQNEKAQAYQKYLEDDKKYIKLDEEYTGLDLDIKSKRKDKDALYHVELPIDGLILTETGAYYNNIHADNWSSEEKFNIFFELMLSVNPELRLMWLDDAEKIGSAMLEVYRKKCTENDFLAILTQVRDYPEDLNKENGVFYIKGGEIIN